MITHHVFHRFGVRIINNKRHRITFLGFGKQFIGLLEQPAGIEREDLHLRRGLGDHVGYNLIFFPETGGERHLCAEFFVGEFDDLLGREALCRGKVFLDFIGRHI